MATPLPPLFIHGWIHALHRHPALWPRPCRWALLCISASMVAILLSHLLGPGLWPQAVVSETRTTPQLTRLPLTREIQALQAQHVQLTQALAQHAQRWPDQRLPQVLQDIQRTARQHGLTLDVFKPLPLRTGPSHVALPVHIKLQASHGAMLGFLRDVSQLARPVGVSDLHIHASPTALTSPHHGSTPQVNDTILTLEAQLSVMRLLSVQELAQRKTDKTSASTTLKMLPVSGLASLDVQTDVNPFDAQRLNQWLRAQQPVHEPSWLSAERARVPQWLERYPLDQLQLVGQLMQNGQRVALIKAAQRIHTVRVGQYLGPQAGRVLSIEEQALTLREIFQDEAGLWQQRLVVLKLERSS